MKEKERIFVTRDRDDFLVLTAEFYRAGEPHPGVLIVPGSLLNNHSERITHALKRWTRGWILPEVHRVLDRAGGSHEPSTGSGMLP